MKVLFFGTYDETVHPRTRVLRQGFEAHGDDVTVHNVPLGVSTAERVALLSRPSRLPSLAVRILACWARLVGLRARERPRPELVVVGYLGHFDVLLAKLLFPRTPIALDYLISAHDTALDRRHASPMLLRVLRNLDRVACAAASHVLVDTEENRSTVPPEASAKAIVVPVGAPTEWFSKPLPRPDARPMRVVFFGLFTPLQGAPVVAEGVQRALDRDAELTATIIGSGQDHEEARRLGPSPLIDWQDWVDADALPGVVAEHDVCLGIFGDTVKARRVVPNKAYQGIAAGCLLVTSDTPPQRTWLPPETEFIPPGDAAALADVLVRLASSEDVDVHRARSWRAASTTLAPQHVVVALRNLLTTPGADSRTASGAEP